MREKRQPPLRRQKPPSEEGGECGPDEKLGESESSQPAEEEGEELGIAANESRSDAHGDDDSSSDDAAAELAAIRRFKEELQSLLAADSRSFQTRLTAMS